MWPSRSSLVRVCIGCWRPKESVPKLRPSERVCREASTDSERVCREASTGVRKSLSRSFDTWTDLCHHVVCHHVVDDVIPIQALFLTRRLNNLYRHELCILQGNGTVGKPCNFAEPKLPELPGLKRCQSCQGSKDEPIGAIKKWQHGAKTQSGGKPS